MWQHLRSSPSMVVAVVSLVFALLCVLYVMERPGTIALGSPSPNGMRLVEWGAVGPNRPYLWDGHYGAPYGFPATAIAAWRSVDKTVPEGKAWIVIVSPAHAISEVVGKIGRSDLSFPPDITARFEFTRNDGERYSAAWLESGTWHDLDLVIDFSICSPSERFWGVPAVYLVLEVDSELKG